MRDSRSLLGGILLAALTLAVGARTAQAQDPVKAAPKQFKVLLDNDRVRVLDFNAKAGEKTPMHSHPDYLVYSVSGGKTKFTSSTGKTTELDTKPGSATWRPAETHSSENVGSGEIHVVIVELKGPAKKTTASKKK